MRNLLASLWRIRAIARKELLVLLGDRVSRMMLILPPIIQIFTFGYAATLEVKNIHIGILNHDHGYYSRDLERRIGGSPSFTRLVHLESEQEMKKALDRQDILLALVFDQEFSRQIERGKPASFQALLDGRKSNSAQLAASYVSEIANRMIPELPEAERKSAENGLNISARYWFNPNLEFQWFFLPNLIGILSLMLGLIVTGLSVAREREMGTFSQLLVSPASPAEIALGKLAPGCLVGLFEGAILWLIAKFGFGVPFIGSLWLFWLALFIFSMSASSLGLMISSLCQTQQQALLGAFTVGVPSILISGAVTPVLNMPEILQLLSQINPLRHFIIINLGLFLKESSLEAAFWNLGKIALLAFIFLGIAIWMFRART